MRPSLRASLGYYLPTNVMVVVGIAAAVAVLAGALLVGASVRDSLRELALGRLGATDVVVSSQTFFRSALSDSLTAPSSTSPVQSAAPLIVAAGAAVHDESRRTAGRVMVYGIDERFEHFHGVAGLSVSGRDALVNRALADELGAAAGDTLDHPRRAADRHSAVDDSGPKGTHRRQPASRGRPRARSGAVGRILTGAGAGAGSRRLRANERGFNAIWSSATASTRSS